MEQSFEPFEKKARVTFSDKKLLMQAFLHRSYLNEHREIKLNHNERLEFLGDAVLELVTTEHLFKKYPKKNEGELTSYRAALVNTNMLSRVAKELMMDDYLLLSKGEARDIGRARQYILANTYEAFVGALYLDQGYETTRAFIDRTVLVHINEVVEKKLWQDYKSHFQEIAQERESVTPTYQTLKEEGPDHDRRFVIGVFLGDERIAEGAGQSKQEAEQEAARHALVKRSWN